MIDWSKRNTIFILCCLGLIVWLISALYSEGYYQADEHFQILEFAGYKAGQVPVQNLAWEFSEKMRPGFQPFIAWCFVYLAGYAGLNDPFVQATIIRILTTICAFLIVMFFYRRFSTLLHSSKSKFLLLFLFFFFWFMPPLAVRFSSENLSGLMTLLFVSFWISLGRKQTYTLVVLSGLAAGFAFLFRYQSSIIIIGFLLWLIIIYKPSFKILALLILSISIPVLSGLIFDRWLYGEWTISAWNYFRANMLEGRLSGFGIKPWHHYFTSGTEQLFLPIGILIWISVLIFWLTKPKSVITWISLPFILLHILIGHKEVRFLFPVLYFLPVFVIQIAIFLSGKPVFNRQWVQYLLIIILVILNLLPLSIIISRPMDQYVATVHRIHKENNKPAVLFYSGNDPQCPFGLKAFFYTVPGIKSIKLKDEGNPTDRIYGNDTAYFVFDELHGISVRDPAQYKLILYRYPQWMSRININHWLDRTSTYSLYQIIP